MIKKCAEWYEQIKTQKYIEHAYKGPEVTIDDYVTGRKSKRDFQIAQAAWLFENLELRNKLKMC